MGPSLVIDSPLLLHSSSGSIVLLLLNYSGVFGPPLHPLIQTPSSSPSTVLSFIIPGPALITIITLSHPSFLLLLPLPLPLHIFWFFYQPCVLTLAPSTDMES